MTDGLDQLGPRLRAARRARGLTLDELAADAGMSASSLSRLESGKRQASLELLVPLTRRLGIRIDDLLVREAPDPRVRRAVVHREGLVITPLAPEHSPVSTYRIVYPPVRELPALRVHDGYEWLYVLSGRLRLRLGEQDLVLTRGEAAEFDTSIPHAMSAAGGRAATVLSIFNDVGERMHTHVADERAGRPGPDERAETSM
ncbi:helix-turn-helix transcriptional regulator [Pseudoclavibacter chungangensis]|uniref:Helix-turn-helix transcriptional regulator n=1 Tax=Pseudoclavibacter chungangensis TaxID=587635 RepID=A0A7J5BRC0_9MICO|nr:XRE family transcriptional regulator [Pseudoclavibacter chungangensis]KAB1654793.1 helix-turn-helix transcriptional regulator [Pseudoclavibacter chungangensis]NYJ68094.1 transcriptional regulator with XRE-family HTH domain [Pseudoclavibacter chungangensis]